MIKFNLWRVAACALLLAIAGLPSAFAEVKATPLAGDTRLVQFHFDADQTYLVLAKPKAVTHIQFGADELIQSVAAGDTANEAAAYFTMLNTMQHEMLLTGASSGAGNSTVLHTDGMNAAQLVLQPNKPVTLSPGNGHLMISGLVGELKVGDKVNIQLVFEHLGPVLFQAPVIGIFDPLPDPKTVNAYVIGGQN